MKITRKGKLRGLIMLAAVFSLVLSLFPGTVARADVVPSMFDSPYVVPYSYYDVEDGETRYFVTLDLPKPIDTNQDTEYVPHKFKEYYDPINLWKKTPSFYYKDKVVETGVVGTLPTLNVGEHYYRFDRNDVVPISRWKTIQYEGRCIHKGNKEHEWAGLSVGDDICTSAYWSGFGAICADCGEEVFGGAFVYAPPEAVETIKSWDMKYGYYYICQNDACRHLEQEMYPKPHRCKKISPNMYEVVYNKNGAVHTPGGDENDFKDVKGIMHPSFHMYNNATEYEGMTVEPVTHLTVCSYSRPTYTFVGWNTKPDGSGTSFADGQEILNLSEYNYLDEDKNIDPRGVITLYAQWVPTESTLEIDPDGGTYDGNSGITSIKQGYGTKYTADPNKIVPKSIHKVSYDTKGGNPIDPTNVPRKFTSWKQGTPFKGKMVDNDYYYIAPNNNIDRLTALYENEPIILPTPSRPGYSFGGWYEDPECEKKPVGFGGDPYLAKGNTTLYAKWSQLVLWSYDDYVSNGRKGAADLKWQQNDAYVKTYKLYQSPDSTNWNQLGADGATDLSKVEKSYSYTGTQQTYKIPSTGFYTLTAKGAKGGDYGTHVGGNGGEATAKFYLTKDTILTIKVGGTSGGGNADTYGKGGGATSIYAGSTLLMVAGGGGGATEFNDGGAGGLETSTRADNDPAGESGNAGGGSGYVGGTAGNVERHYHSDECKIEHVHNATCWNTQIVEKTCNLSGGHWESNRSETCGNCHAPGNTMRYYAVGFNHSVDRSICNGYGIGEGYWKCTNCNTYGYSHGGLSTSATSHTYSVTEPVLICTITSGGCKYGYTDGQVIGSTIAYGGSSFVNGSAVSSSKTAGTVGRNGSFKIESAGLGMSGGTVMNDVPANDLAAPDAIPGYKKEPLTQSIIRIYWEEPADNGTPYWFRAESFNAETGDKLCDSNITKNTLTTGVAGYYYTFGKTITNPVTASNAKNAGSPYTGRTLDCTLTEEDVNYYLCIAAVDVAGNVGPTTTITLSRNGSDEIPWAVKTDQISITKFRTTDDNVYQNSSGDWYVRADGHTPFKLAFDSYIDGYASDTYQIDEQNFYLAFDVAGNTYEYATNLPKSASVGSLTAMAPLNVGDFVRRGSGSETILIDASNTGASRGVRGTKNSFWQGFTAPSSTSGRVVVVTPGAGAGATGTGVTYRHSDWGEDVGHGLVLHPDGVAPTVTANQDFDSLSVINAATISDHAIIFTAADDLSGLRSFTVKVTNQDNGISHVFEDTDHDGVISLTFDETSPQFDGDVIFECIATDNVGNVNTRPFGKAEYTMTATIEHAGYNPAGATTFRRGDPAVLHVETTGYADTIMIEVPDEIKSGYPSDQVDFYGLTEYRTARWINFVVPDDCPAGNYTFIVHSYKNGSELEARPAMITIIDQGITGDVRIRLR